MNLRDKINSIDWDARESQPAPPRPATLKQQATRNRATPETAAQQQQRVQTLRAKIIQQEIEAEQRRIAAMKHHHVARVNGRVMLVAGKPPTGGVGSYASKRSTTKTDAIPDVIRTTGYVKYCLPWVPGNDDGVVMY